MSAIALSESEPDQAIESRPPGQRLLFSPEIEVSREKEEAAGYYTAARLREKRPQVYEEIIDQLGGGVGMLRLAKRFGVHHLTVAAVRDAEPEKIDIARGKMVTDLRHVARLQIERLKEHPECVPIAFAGQLIDQAIRNAELLDGRATSRSEHTERIDVYAEFNAVLEQLPSERRLGDEEVRELPAGTGLLAGENVALKEPAPADAERVRDAESLVNELPTDVTDRSDTTSDTDPAASHAGDGDSQTGGRGGSARSAGGPSSPMDTASQKFSGNASLPSSTE